MRLFANLPYIKGSAAEMAHIDRISITLVSGLGFSNGCAEFAPKKPPPFVPKCLIDSNEATGPIAIC
ncbi:hypothetical protein D1872_343180 [compost metagenome]